MACRRCSTPAGLPWSWRAGDGHEGLARVAAEAAVEAAALLAPGQDRRHFRLVAREPVFGAPVGCTGRAARRLLSPGPLSGPPLRVGRKGGQPDSQSGAALASLQRVESLRKKRPLFS